MWPKVNEEFFKDSPVQAKFHLCNIALADTSDGINGAAALRFIAFEDVWRKSSDFGLQDYSWKKTGGALVRRFSSLAPQPGVSGVGDFPRSFVEGQGTGPSFSIPGRVGRLGAHSSGLQGLRPFLFVKSARQGIAQPVRRASFGSRVHTGPSIRAVSIVLLT